MDKVLVHIADVTRNVTDGGSKWAERQVCRPSEENDGSFRQDKSGRRIVLGMMVLLTIAVWFFTR